MKRICLKTLAMCSNRKKLLALAVFGFIAHPGAAIESTTIGLAGAPAFGRPDAPVTLVEFTDYECRFCWRHATRVQPKLIEDYVETGKLRYVMRTFPREDGPGAKAAEAALCAADQGEYLPMHRALLNNQSTLAVDHLQPLGLIAGLDMRAFKSCLTEGRHAAEVQRDFRDAKQAGIKAVPAFFLGLTDPVNPGEVRVLRMFTGAKRYGYFQEVIEQLLSEAAQPSETQSEATGRSDQPSPP